MCGSSLGVVSLLIKYDELAIDYGGRVWARVPSRWEGKDRMDRS